MRKFRWKLALPILLLCSLPCQAADHLSSLSCSISAPFLQLLEWTHSLICANWGWDIVFLTILVNVALSPLRWKIWKNSKAFEQLQPRLEEIRNRYKRNSEKDRKKMLEALGTFQKREGVNPASSLVGMLIQWPILIGFLRMLSSAKYLAFASWLWIPNLAAPDPYHLLSVLFLVSMALPALCLARTGAKTKQQKSIHLISSFFMTLMTWKSAAALLLYWGCSNLFGLLQQLFFEIIYKQPPTS